jgi:hypothetical protein
MVDPDFDRIPTSSGDPYNIPNILHHLQENAVGLPQNWLPRTGIETGADLMVAARVWLEKLQQVRSADIIKILTQIPAERMSDKIYQFIVNLLENSIKQL